MTWSLSRYPQHWVCTKCCISFKSNRNINKKYKKWDYESGPSCHKCGQKGIIAGRDFRAPKQKNKKEWKKVIKMLKHGIKFHEDYGYRNGYRFKNMKELDQFIAGPIYFYMLEHWNFKKPPDKEISENYEREKKRYMIKTIQMTPYELEDHFFISKDVII